MLTPIVIMIFINSMFGLEIALRIILALKVQDLTLSNCNLYWRDQDTLIEQSLHNKIS